MTTLEILQRANSAKSAIALADSGVRNSALAAMAIALEKYTLPILAANVTDVEAARGTISDVMLDRLTLSAERIQAMADGVRELMTLPDPVGQVLHREERPNGLII